jgi:tRNA pseudouridine38-40 synthase
LTRRYFIELSFKGTRYHGWQTQVHAVTIQSTLEASLYQISRAKIQVVGAGRTDTGVHARYFVAHFDAGHDLFHKKTNFLHKINSVLPDDIAVHDIRRVKSEAHARYSAISRTYEYTIRQYKDPFLTDLSWFYPQPLNIDKMNEAAKILTYCSDFTSFSKLHSNAKTNNCRIMQAYWEERNRLFVFTIEADRFLRNMVRAIVGTMVGVGKGKLTTADFTRITDSKDRRMALHSAPAHGLSLVQVKYPDEIYL